MTIQQTDLLFIQASLIECIENMKNLENGYQAHYIDNTKKIILSLLEGIDFDVDNLYLEINKEISTIYEVCYYELTRIGDIEVITKEEVSDLIQLFDNLLGIFQDINNELSKNDDITMNWYRMGK